MHLTLLTLLLFLNNCLSALDGAGSDENAKAPDPPSGRGEESRSADRGKGYSFPGHSNRYKPELVSAIQSYLDVQKPQSYASAVKIISSRTGSDVVYKAKPPASCNSKAFEENPLLVVDSLLFQARFISRENSNLDYGVQGAYIDYITDEDAKRETGIRISLVGKRFVAPLLCNGKNELMHFWAMAPYPFPFSLLMISERFFVYETDKTFKRMRHVAAELVMALETLHKHNVTLFLTPWSFFITADGHVAITNFSLAVTTDNPHIKKHIIDLVPSGYHPPELLSDLESKETTVALDSCMDWWLLGKLMVQSAVLPPVRTNEPDSLKDFRALTQRLMSEDPQSRLGCKNDAETIKGNKFFKEISFEGLKVLNPGSILMPEKMKKVVDAYSRYIYDGQK